MTYLICRVPPFAESIGADSIGISGIMFVVAVIALRRFKSGAGGWMNEFHDLRDAPFSAWFLFKIGPSLLPFCVSVASGTLVLVVAKTTQALPCAIWFPLICSAVGVCVLAFAVGIQQTLSPSRSRDLPDWWRRLDHDR